MAYVDPIWENITQNALRRAVFKSRPRAMSFAYRYLHLCKT